MRDLIIFLAFLARKLTCGLTAENPKFTQANPEKDLKKMKTVTKLLLLITLCCTCTYYSSAQKSGSKPRKPAKSKVVCSVEAVPQGMVVVGYKTNAVCESGSELLVKRPTDSETVCANSPVPDDYTVQNITGNAECRDASPNPLTDALVITRSGRAVSTSTTSTPSLTRPAYSREITVKVTRQNLLRLSVAIIYLPFTS